MYRPHGGVLRIIRVFDQVFSSSFFITMSNEFTFGDNFDYFSIFMNLDERDLTEYQITQTLTLS